MWTEPAGVILLNYSRKRKGLPTKVHNVRLPRYIVEDNIFAQKTFFLKTFRPECFPTRSPENI